METQGHWGQCNKKKMVMLECCMNPTHIEVSGAGQTAGQYIQEALNCKYQKF